MLSCRFPKNALQADWNGGIQKILHLEEKISVQLILIGGFLHPFEKNSQTGSYPKGKNTKYLKHFKITT